MRKHVRAALELGKGTCGGVIERGVMVVARKARGHLTDAELEDIAVAPEWLTNEWCRSILAGKMLLVVDPAVPDVPTPVDAPAAVPLDCPDEEDELPTLGSRSDSPGDEAPPLGGPDSSDDEQGADSESDASDGEVLLKKLKTGCVAKFSRATARSKGRDTYVTHHRQLLKDECQKERRILLEKKRPAPKLEAMLRTRGNERWSKLSDADKAPYIAAGCQPKEKYQDEFGMFRSAHPVYDPDSIALSDLEMGKIGP